MEDRGEIEEEEQEEEEEEGRGQEDDRLAEGPAEQAGLSVEVQIGRKLREIGDKFQQEHVELVGLTPLRWTDSSKKQRKKSFLKTNVSKTNISENITKPPREQSHTRSQSRTPADAQKQLSSDNTPHFQSAIFHVRYAHRPCVCACVCVYERGGVFLFVAVTGRTESSH